MSALAADSDSNGPTHRVRRPHHRATADTGGQLTGSSQSVKPRWLAKETPRQYLSSAAAVLAIVPLAVFTGIRFDIAEGMPRYLTQLIYIYAVIMIVSTLVYVPLTLFAFRKLSGSALSQVCLLYTSPSPRDD